MFHYEYIHRKLCKWVNLERAILRIPWFIKYHDLLFNFLPFSPPPVLRPAMCGLLSASLQVLMVVCRHVHMPIWIFHVRFYVNCVLHKNRVRFLFMSACCFSYIKLNSESLSQPTHVIQHPFDGCVALIFQDINILWLLLPPFSCYTWACFLFDCY